MTWYDLSPMRPDDFARTNVFRWREAVACRGAYERGVQNATQEAENWQRLMQEDFQA
jgi:hypothetical protein